MYRVCTCVFENYIHFKFKLSEYGFYIIHDPLGGVDLYLEVDKYVPTMRGLYQDFAEENINIPAIHQP